MPDLISLRTRAIDLAERKRAVAGAVADLEAVHVTLDAAMLAHARAWVEDDEDETHLDGEPGDRVPLFSDTALYAILGSGDSGDFSPRGFVMNSLHAIQALRKYAAVDDAVSEGGSPSLDGLTRFEVEAIVDRYKARISDMTADLRDVGTRLRYVRATRSKIPAYAKGRCLGMFGGADRDAGFSYTERDFSENATERVPRQRPDPHDPRGPTYVEFANRHPHVFEERFLAATVGPEAAKRVEAALSRIEAATAPRPGEPELLRHFGSHATNRIEIDYAPGEADVDDAPPVAAIP